MSFCVASRRAIRRVVFSRRPASSVSGNPLRVCIVGSGPAGFYTAHQLVKVSWVCKGVLRQDYNQIHYLTELSLAVSWRSREIDWFRLIFSTNFLFHLAWYDSEWHLIIQRSRCVYNSNHVIYVHVHGVWTVLPTIYFLVQIILNHTHY